MRYLPSLLLAFLLSVLSVSHSHADLVAGWDFQTTTNGGTAVAASPNTPKQYVANFGSATMFLNGLNGSSDWFVPSSGSTNTELNGFSGSNLNLGPGFSSTTTGMASLALVNQSANGKHAVFRFSMAGFQDLAVSYASQRSSTGFTNHVWSYSTNGTTWTEHQTISSIPTSFGVQTLTTITGLNGAADAYLRLTASGATGGTGTNRLDNIQFNASSVPEPGSFLLISGVALGGTLLRRRIRR